MYKETKWATDILAAQGPDGLWGGFFHSLAAPRGNAPLATEQALRRLHNLGYTAEDPPVARALETLRAVLRGQRCLVDRREATHDWNLFTELMAATWLRLFLPDDPDACWIADRWAEVLTAAFAGGAYDPAAYRTAYTAVFGMPPCGARFVDFCSFYVATLVANRLDAVTERAVFSYVLDYPQGIYYIYDKPIRTPPEFASRKGSRYVGALELLALWRSDFCVGSLRFAREWILSAEKDGVWDFGHAARDGVYLPLSDSWRGQGARQADSTARVRTLLARM